MGKACEIPKHTLLIVEDDQEVQAVMTRYLSNDGFATVHAGSVEEAKLALEQNPEIHLVLLDLIMPNQSGFDLLAFLRSSEVYAEIPILILTALDAAGDRVKGLEAGADDYLTKPYDMREMVARARVLLRQYDCTRAARARTQEAEEALAEQQRLLRQLAETNEALEKASVIKNNFISAASHDLRSPLTNVKGYCELLLTQSLGSLTPEQSDALAVIQRNTNHVLDLLGKLLDVSRLEAGEYPLNISQYPLSEMITTATNMSILSAREKGIALRIDEDADTSGRILCDRDAFISMMENLIGNAVKFCKEGDSVVISSRIQDGMVHVSVADTGPGIPEDEREKLFQRFSRLSNRPTGGEKSVGLGLSIVRDLAALQGGGVSLESVRGEGSTFTISLPLTS